MIALSFDDGPDPVWTPRVLDALARADARATFFVLGPRVEAHPDVVTRVLDAGHEVGLHGWGHLRHPDHAEAEVAGDADRALVALDRLGVRPHAWRLPWGRAAPFSARLASERGLTIADWTLDTHDWRGDPASAMLARVFAGLGEPDAVVLAHDALGPGAARDGCAETVTLVEPLVAAARGMGQVLVRLDALTMIPTGRGGSDG